MTQPPPPPTEDPVRSYSTIIAVLGAVLVTLLIILVVVLLTRGDEEPSAGPTETFSPSTTLAGGLTTGTTQVAPSTAATTIPVTTLPSPTTTLPPPTTTTLPPPTTTTLPPTTTTIPPFDGTLDDKSGTLPAFLPARVADIRYGNHANFTRVVFDLEQGEADAEPWDGSYFLRYGANPSELQVMLYPAFYNGDAVVPVGVGSVDEVESTGPGAGSGEWAFTIRVGPDAPRPFKVFTLDNPRRLVVDVGH